LLNPNRWSRREKFANNINSKMGKTFMVICSKYVDNGVSPAGACKQIAMAQLELSKGTL